MNEYQTIIRWSKVDGVYVVNVPELPGCMAHGESREEALRRAREAVDFWIETARDDGRRVPAPRSER